MICAGFLAAASIDGNNPDILPQSISRYYKFLPGPQEEAFLSEGQMTRSTDKIARRQRYSNLNTSAM